MNVVSTLKDSGNVLIDVTDILDTFHLPRLKICTVFEE